MLNLNKAKKTLIASRALALTVGAITWALSRFAKKPDTKLSNLVEDIINLLGFGYGAYSLGRV